MHVRRVRPGDDGYAFGLLAAIVFGIVFLLDCFWPLGARAAHADVFSAIWAAIQVVGSALGAAGGAIAASLEGVVSYLVSAVAWLSGRIASILLSTGAMFSRVWDGLRVIWSDVLRPALVWVDQQLQRLQAWLKDTFAPVFRFLRTVSAELQAIYRRFVQPIIDTIEFVRAINRVLLAFHITLLQQLDAVLQKIEQRVEEPFLWVNAKLNEIWNALELVVTVDGFFQRLTLLRSMSRYAPAWMRIATNARMRQSAPGDSESRARATIAQAPADLITQLGAYVAGDTNDTGLTVDANVERLSAFWNAT